jgi:hypothetical protein
MAGSDEKLEVMKVTVVFRSSKNWDMMKGACFRRRRKLLVKERVIAAMQMQIEKDTNHFMGLRRGFYILDGLRNE